MTRRGRFALIVIFTGAIVAAGWWLRDWWMPQEAVWRQAVASAPATEAADVMRRAAAAGAEGMPALVDALSVSDEKTATTAVWVLLDELDRWERRPASVHQEAVARLATELAKRQAQLSPAAHQRAGRIARRILCWPFQGSQHARLEVVKQCQAVLSSPSSSPADSQPASNTALPPIVGIPVDFRPEPVRAVPLAPMPLEAEANPAIVHAISHPTPIPSQQDTGSTLANRPLAIQSKSAPATPAIHTASFDAPASGNSRSAAPLALPGPLAARNDSVAKAPGVSSDVLMRRVATGSPQEAAEARNELAGRGMGARQLELLDRLRDPNPSVRRELAQSLPAERGIDVSAWLLILADDPSGDVRLAALSLLATAGNPDLRERVLQRSATDADSRVRRLAQQLRPDSPR